MIQFTVLLHITDKGKKSINQNRRNTPIFFLKSLEASAEKNDWNYVSSEQNCWDISDINVSFVLQT